MNPEYIKLLNSRWYTIVKNDTVPNEVVDQFYMLVVPMMRHAEDNDIYIVKSTDEIITLYLLQKSAFDIKYRLDKIERKLEKNETSIFMIYLILGTSFILFIFFIYNKFFS